MKAEAISRALGGRRTGTHWMAPCPGHEDRNPSLSIRDADDGKVLVHCHAGCDQALVIAELRSRDLWDGSGDNRRLPNQNRLSRSPDVRPAEDCVNRTVSALRLWSSAVPAAGTTAETYLRSRGIGVVVPPSIRFHPRLRHPSGGVWCGLVALVTCGHNGQPVAIHRTFLSHDGAGKAPVSPQKMMLGPCRGGAVRLAVAGTELMIGEGIETCLAAIQATGLPAWAALSTSGLRGLELPARLRNVTILADGDEPGGAAAVDAARRWVVEGRVVRIARPPRGMDFNDVLLDRRSVNWQGVA